MISEFQDLSDKIDRLAQLTQALRSENYLLRQANTLLSAENVDFKNRLIATKVLGHEPTRHEAPNVLEEYGNTSSAGSLVAFHEHSADLAKGDLGHLCSFGAGYTAGSIILRKLH